jgi:hypothetical protein
MHPLSMEAEIEYTQSNLNKQLEQNNNLTKEQVDETAYNGIQWTVCTSKQP